MFAAAGVELHVIQLWFRWGSKAVERYIRDAPLSSSFALAGRISLAMAGDRYAQAARRRLPRSVVRRRAGGRELLKKMSELDEKLDLALAEKLSFAPKFVLNKSSGFCHFVKDQHLTACGWNWAKDPCAVVTFKPSEPHCPRPGCRVRWRASK